MTAPVRTPHHPGQLIEAIDEAYELEVGGEIPVKLLLALASQWALETARGDAMWNDNPGNLRGVGDAGTTSIAGATEVINGHEVTIPAGFAAFSSLLAGTRAFVRYLCVATKPPAPNRYQAAIDAATRGDLAGFVNGLHDGGYFTASEDRYLRAEVSQAHWLEKLPEMHAWLETTP